MRVDRIAAFAEAMVPSLSDLAGETIKSLDRVPPGRRQATFEGLYNVWTERGRETAYRLMDEMFSPLNPWSQESAIAAAQLLQSAFFLALEQGPIWDRRLSARTIASRLRAKMHDHIDNFANDRGMNRDLFESLDIGFEDITLEAGHP